MYDIDSCCAGRVGYRCDSASYTVPIWRYILRMAFYLSRTDRTTWVPDLFHLFSYRTVYHRYYERHYWCKTACACYLQTRRRVWRRGTPIYKIRATDKGARTLGTTRLLPRDAPPHRPISINNRSSPAMPIRDDACLAEWARCSIRSRHISCTAASWSLAAPKLPTRPHSTRTRPRPLRTGMRVRGRRPFARTYWL